MREVLLTIGTVGFEGKWAVGMSSQTETCMLECNPDKWCSPFYGRRMDAEEIRELIDFLQKTLEEKEDHEQSNLE